MMTSIFSVTITFIVILATIFLTMKEKIFSSILLKSSFECGFNPINQKKMTFSTNFMLIAMLFLIFDIEITFLIPISMSNTSLNMWSLMMSMLFIVILTIMLMKEWKQGSMEWSK